MVEIPAGDFRVSRPIELTAPNTALHGEVNAATTLTWSGSGQWSGPFTFVRSGLDELSSTENEDFIDGSDAGEPVGDEDDGAAPRPREP